MARRLGDEAEVESTLPQVDARELDLDAVSETQFTMRPNGDECQPFFYEFHPWLKSVSGDESLDRHGFQLYEEARGQATDDAPPPGLSKS
jgi:hypothetical protein